MNISQRKIFADELYKQMEKNQDIWLITFDLGYKMFDSIRDRFPERFINTGAAEQAGMDIAVGLALAGKIPFVYSITPFALYRPFETIRNYINREKIPVKIIGGGRDRDYEMDGFSHWAEEDKAIMKNFPHILSFWPEDLQVQTLIELCVKEKWPYYINLKR